MSVSNQAPLENFALKSNDYDGLIMFSYAVFAITFLVLIYAASGAASGDFASMSAFP